MTTINRVKEVEDFLCDFLTALFSDSVACKKEFDGSLSESRACSITDIAPSVDDQGVLRRYHAVYKEITKTRLASIEHINRIQAAFPIFNRTTTNGLAISIELNYITAPIKIMVGTTKSYRLSANLRVTTT